MLTGATAAEEWPGREIFMQWHRGDVPVRYRNFAVITQKYKLYRPREDQADELYDLSADPGEQEDIAEKHLGLVEELRTRYDEWLDEMAGTRGWGSFDPPPIHLGTPHENPVVLSRNDWRIIGEEGWCRNDLRGYWEVLVAQDGTYRIAVRFREGGPSGKVHFRMEEIEVSQEAGAGQAICCFEEVQLRPGRGRIEAWLETDQPCEGALHRRFVPALYVEVEKRG